MGEAVVVKKKKKKKKTKRSGTKDYIIADIWYR